MFYDNNIMFNYEGKTSGIKNFMTETFLANKWVKVPEEIAYIFFNRVKELYAKIDANIEENNYLIKQRGELLPLLMNGQVSLNSDLSIYYTFYKYTQAQRQLATMPIIDYTQIADTIPLIFEVLQHAVPFWHSEQPQVL